MVCLALAPLTGVAMPAPGMAQVREVDRGVLLISRGPRLIGREEFVVRRGRGSGTMAGFTVASTAWYPPDRPQRSLTSVVEFGTDSLPTAIRVEASNGDLKRVLISIGPRRLTVRLATANGESAREHPVREPHVIVDDSILATHTLPPTPRSLPLRTMTMSGTRGPLAEIIERGWEPTPIGGTTRELKRFTIQMGDAVRHLWYDAEGRLWKVADPARNTVAVRQLDEPDAR
jgi:hypothetical protein